MRRNYIKEYRMLRGIETKVELAHLAGVPRSTIGEIENHKMRGSDDTLERIAKALGLSKAELYVNPE